MGRGPIFGAQTWARVLADRCQVDLWRQNNVASHKEGYDLSVPLCKNTIHAHVHVRDNLCMFKCMYVVFFIICMFVCALKYVYLCWLTLGSLKAGARSLGAQNGIRRVLQPTIEL